MFPCYLSSSIITSKSNPISSSTLGLYHGSSSVRLDLVPLTNNIIPISSSTTDIKKLADKSPCKILKDQKLDKTMTLAKTLLEAFNDDMRRYYWRWNKPWQNDRNPRKNRMERTSHGSFHCPQGVYILHLCMWGVWCMSPFFAIWVCVNQNLLEWAPT